MKRLLFFAALIVAIASIGGNILTARAQATSGPQTLTPTEVATLQQELAVAKATLANLEMQAGMVPPSDAGTPTVVTGLSAAQVNEFNSVLSTLATTLGQLNASLATNATLTPSQAMAVQNTLNGMGSTLVAMANTISNANNAPIVSAPVASTQPATSPVAVNTAPSTAAAPSAATTQSPTVVTAPATTPAAPATANSVPQTAQASSLWSFTKAHWPTIVIILLVIAILVILFWPEKKESVRTVSTSTAGSGKPKSAPTAPVIMSQGTTSAPKPPMNSATPPPATPVANAVAAPSQK